MFENITKGKWRHNKFAKGNVETDNRLIANCAGYSTNVNPEQAYKESIENADFIIFCGNLQQCYDISKLEEVVSALENSKEVIENLIASKRIVNLDEALAYYEQLLKQIKK